jgi:dUTP pyrophosphatase
MLYFAHPVDQASSAEVLGYTNLVRQMVGIYDWVYDPGQAFHTAEVPFDARVQLTNMAVLEKADAVFAMFPPNGQTVGVAAEVIQAVALGIPTMVYAERMPIGLGHLAVPFWKSTPVPGERRDDVRSAVLALMNLPAPAIPFGIPVAKDGQRSGQDGDLGSVLPDLCYSGPLQAVRRYEGDAAWDVPAAETVTLRIGARARIKTGVYVAPPPDVWIAMVGRSSNFARGIFVESGVIDSGWRGELEAKVYNLAGEPVTIEAGERIAQLIPHEIVAQQLNPVNVGGVEGLPYGDRGSNGWGSTGS